MSKTSGYSTHPSTPAAWISLQADSLARIFPPPAKGQALRANGQDSGASSPASFAWYDPASSSLKTAQCSLFGDLMSSSLTLPRSGSMRSGRLYQRPRLVLPIAGNGSGYWQTPVADDAVNRIKGKINSRGEPKLSAQVLWRTPTVGMLNADRAKDPEYANRKRAKGQTITLADQVKWPTPRARDGQPEGLQSGMDRMGKYATCSLPTAVALWPTPTVFGGSLNPVWVCWLMNFPLNWFQAGGTPSPMSDESLPASKTGLANSRPLAMPKCRCNVLSPGEC